MDELGEGADIILLFRIIVDVSPPTASALHWSLVLGAGFLRPSLFLFVHRDISNEEIKAEELERRMRGR